MALRSHRRTEPEPERTKPFLKPKDVLTSKDPVQQPFTYSKMQQKDEKPIVPKTVDTRKIFDRKPLKQVYGKAQGPSRTHRRRHERQHPLFLDYEEDLADYRNALTTQATATLNEHHSAATTQLDELAARHETLQAFVAERNGLVHAPLAAERVETVTVRNGVAVTETRRIGDAVDGLKTLLARKEAELALAWSEWQAVNAELQTLVTTVLGGSDGKEDDDSERGFRARMQALENEKARAVEAMREDIEIMGREAIESMMAAEKESDSHAKKDQAAFFAKFFGLDN